MWGDVCIGCVGKCIDRVSGEGALISALTECINQVCCVIGGVVGCVNRVCYLDRTCQLHLQLSDLFFELVRASVKSVDHQRHSLLDLSLLGVVDLRS